MKLSRLLGLVCLGMLLAAPTWAEERPAKETCPHAKGWRPTDEELQRTLSDHQQWLLNWREWQARNPVGRANLCNADLRFANLSNANLMGAELNNANLTGVEPNNVKLNSAELNGAELFWAKLNNVELNWAKLNNAKLFKAELNNAILFRAELNNADLSSAKLNNATLTGAKLNGANLRQAELNKAKLHGAELNKANLSGASLRNAELVETSVAGAVLAYADLSNAIYEPVSQPPDSHVADIKGLHTVRFASGRETGLVQLRELIQKAGLRDLERDATFAIENGKTKNAIDNWRKNPGGAAEGIFRLAAFDWTTAYGRDPGRALLLIVALWALLIPIYSWSIWQRPRRLPSSGIYRTWPKDRVEVSKGKPTLENPARVERLRGRGPAALGWAAYFSLLSTFQIGFREFSVGTWLTRTQPRDFVLQPTGWVRTVSGLQSLLSVYLLALWILTYFGRPFQ